MSVSYLLNEIITNNFNYNVLNIISELSISFGIFIIITNNPIISVLFLIGLFITVASYLMVLGINFIGLSYLLVYVGAVSILFLFILMLINIRISELVTNNSNSIPLAIMIGIFFNIIQLFPNRDIILNIENEYVYEYGFNDLYLNTLSFVTSHS